MLRCTTERVPRRLAGPARRTGRTRQALIVILAMEAPHAVVAAGSEDADPIRAELPIEAIAKAAPSSRGAS
jgi:hypothetical protein